MEPAISFSLNNSVNLFLNNPKNYILYIDNNEIKATEKGIITWFYAWLFPDCYKHDKIQNKLTEIIEACPNVQELATKVQEALTLKFNTRHNIITPSAAPVFQQTTTAPNINTENELQTTREPQRAVFFKLNNETEIKNQYKDLAVQRKSSNYNVMKNACGAVNVGYLLKQDDPSAKIGIIIAANSGLPGGDLGYRVGKVNESHLNVTGQEESVWAACVLTMCGKDEKKQEAFHQKTIEGAWGMKNSNKNTTDTETIQNIDFTKTTDKDSYNGVYKVKGCSLSCLNIDQDEKKTLIPNKKYPVDFYFADSVNVAPSRDGNITGTMTRTLNQEAAKNYIFFRLCIKEKLRSSLDAAAKDEITYPLIAELSCGIYAAHHETQINQDFTNILNEVLQEVVGPNGEQRGRYFEQVILPIL